MDLKKHIKQLSTIEPSRLPFVSVYLNLDTAESSKKELELFLTQKLNRFQDEFPAGSRVEDSYRKSLQQIEQFLHHKIEPATRGVALFSRWGQNFDFFLQLQFPLPVENRFVVNSVPHVFPLIQLLDKPFHYMVLITDSRKAQIYEINFVNILDVYEIKRPVDKKNFRGEWTQLHYQNWKREKQKGLIKDELKVLERLMREKEINHLVLAGDEIVISQLKKKLSKWLQNRVIAVTDLDTPGDKSRLISTTIKAFVESERSDQINAVDALRREAATNGLGVTGIEKTLAALNTTKVDQLIIDKNFEAPPGWRCYSCNYLKTGIFSSNCPVCGTKLTQANLKDDMVRQAVLIGAKIETVENDEWLQRNGRIGATLRFL